MNVHLHGTTMLVGAPPQKNETFKTQVLSTCRAITITFHYYFVKWRSVQLSSSYRTMALHFWSEIGARSYFLKARNVFIQLQHFANDLHVFQTCLSLPLHLLLLYWHNIRSLKIPHSLYGSSTENNYKPLPPICFPNAYAVTMGLDQSQIGKYLHLELFHKVLAKCWTWLHCSGDLWCSMFLGEDNEYTFSVFGVMKGLKEEVCRNLNRRAQVALHWWLLWLPGVSS